jgi:hypothetical protein
LQAAKLQGCRRCGRSKKVRFALRHSLAELRRGRSERGFYYSPGDYGLIDGLYEVKTDWRTPQRKDSFDENLPGMTQQYCTHGSAITFVGALWLSYSLLGVLQFDLVASIGRKSCAPIHADDFHIQTVAVYANDYVVVGV